jgi:hypothetical protein
MFGYSKLFRSRWRALFWAAGIIWFAIQVAAPDDPAPTPKPDPNLQKLLE